MKTITTLFVLMTLSSHLIASDCMVKETSKTGKVLVLPHYEATVNYFFNRMTKDAFATVSWSLNEGKTRTCFNEAKAAYSPREVVIPRSSAGDLKVRIFGGEKETSLHILPQSNGHYFGNSDSIKVQFNKKRELEQAIERGDTLVEVTGDLSYTTMIDENKIIANLNCSEENQDAGIMNLLKRIKELEGQISRLSHRGKISMEEVMQEFFGTCVSFRDVEATSFEDFDRQQRVTSNLSREKFSVVGSVSVLKSEPLPGVSGQKTSIFDI